MFSTPITIHFNVEADEEFNLNSFTEGFQNTLVIDGEDECVLGYMAAVYMSLGIDVPEDVRESISNRCLYELGGWDGKFEKLVQDGYPCVYSVNRDGYSTAYATPEPEKFTLGWNMVQDLMKEYHVKSTYEGNTLYHLDTAELIRRNYDLSFTGMDNPVVPVKADITAT